jgi:hypothetical protein
MLKQKLRGLLSCAAVVVLTVTGAHAIVSARADEARDRSYRMAQAADPKKQRIESWAFPVKAPESKKKQLPERPTASATPAKDGQDERGVPAGQLQPQLHASNGGITTCFDSLARASSQAVDGEHQAYSFWDQKRPNEGTFRSIVSLRYPHAAAPRGAAVIINAPVGGACDATTLQITPTLRTCSAVQGDLRKSGKAVANLAGLALIQTPQDLSYLLLPTAGDGCTIVAIRVIRSQ